MRAVKATCRKSLGLERTRVCSDRSRHGGWLGKLDPALSSNPDLTMHVADAARDARYRQDILRIVDCIYAAACAEGQWQRSVEALCRVGNFDGGVLSLVDPLRRQRRIIAAHGRTCCGEPGEAPHATPYHPLLTDSVLRSRPGTIWQDRQVVSWPPSTATWSRSDRMRSHGVGAWTCMIVNQHESHVVCLELYTGADQARPHFVAVDLLTLLAPHLTRAWRLAGVQAAPEPGGSDACRAGYDIAGAAKVTASPAVMRLRADFGLTKAEARLALSLAAGASLLHASEAYDVKLTTIRSQLQQIFAKIGTCRQAELVAMLLNQSYLDGARSDRAGAGPHAGPARARG